MACHQAYEVFFTAESKSLSSWWCSANEMKYNFCSLVHDSNVQETFYFFPMRGKETSFRTQEILLLSISCLFLMVLFQASIHLFKPRKYELITITIGNPELDTSHFPLTDHGPIIVFVFSQLLFAGISTLSVSKVFLSVLLFGMKKLLFTCGEAVRS